MCEPFGTPTNDRLEIISVIVDPTINVHHQSTKVILTDANLGVARDFLLIEDELAGDAGFDPQRGRPSGRHLEPGLSWAAKTPRINPDGSFHLFSNDLNRGLDVFRFDPAAEAPDGLSTWLSADDVPIAATTASSSRPDAVLPPRPQRQLTTPGP